MRDVLACEVRELDFGLPHPILLVSFGDGSAFSVEFTEGAPEESPGDALDDAHAFRGAWIEFRTHDVPAVQQNCATPAFETSRILRARMRILVLRGQVFRILDVGYQGP